MEGGISRKLLVTLYEQRDAPEARSTVSQLLRTSDRVLLFLLYVLFGRDYPELHCPGLFAPLLESKKMVEYLVMRWLGPKVSVDRVYEWMEDPRKKRKAEDSEDVAGLLEFLLLFEKANRKLAQTDPRLLRQLIGRIPGAGRARLIRDVTPLTVLIIKSTPIENLSLLHRQVRIFLKAARMPYEDGFYYIGGTDFGALQDIFVKSKFKQIQRYYLKLVHFFPEIMYGVETPCDGRLNFFRDPLSLPLHVKTTKAYILAYLHFMKQKTGSSLSNINVLLKAIYIERILAEHPSRLFLRRIVHQLILEAPVLIRVSVMRGFRPSIVPRVVECVPSFYLAYDLSLKMLCKNPESPFYSKLTAELLKKYPLESSLEKLRLCAHLLQDTFVKQFEHLMDKNNCT
jgi:hypothetical protein